MSTGGGGWGEGGIQNQLPTFDHESKSAKIQISLCQLGGGGESKTNFQLLIQSLNLLKPKFLFVNGKGEGEGSRGREKFRLCETSGENLGWTTEIWLQNFPLAQTECITDTLRAETKNPHA